MSTGTRRRTRTTQPNQQPQPEVPMQPPTTPTIAMNEDGLRKIWEDHKEALFDADEAGKKAAALEQSFATRRQTAREVRERIEELTAKAVELEADANTEEKTAQGLRSDEQHYRDTAAQLLNAVNFLGQSNALMHPAEREKRDAELAEQRAAAQALTLQATPLDHLVAPPQTDMTQPFPRGGEQL